MEGVHLVRPRHNPGQALYRHRATRCFIPPGARGGRRPDPFPPDLLAGWRGGSVRGRGQGVRAAGRRDDRADRGGFRPAAAAHGPQHRGAELQPGGPGGSHLWNRSYYVEPEPAGIRAYVLLRDALERSGKVAVTRVALRQRESLAVLRSRDGLLVLETMLWPDEVRAADFPFLEQDIDVRTQELRMASSLIDSMTEDFDPDQYRDGYREALEELVEAKAEGRDVTAPSGPAAPEEPASLLDALQASLDAATRNRGPAPARRRAGRKASA